MRTLLLALLVACDDTAIDRDASPGYDAAMWKTLFDGQLGPAWRMSTIVNQPGADDPGRFEIVDGALLAIPGNDIGLLWYTEPAPPDFELELEWRRSEIGDNSGVFVRFPDIDSKGYNNTAYVAVRFGFEIQIDELGFPDGAHRHTTGAIYEQTEQAFTRVPAKPLGEWNVFSIRVVGQTYTVVLNGAQTTRFENRDPARGAPAPAFVGLQTHPPPGAVAFRNIRIRAL